MFSLKWIEIKKELKKHSLSSGYFNTTTGEKLVKKANEIYLKMSPDQIRLANQNLSPSDTIKKATEKEMQEYRALVQKAKIGEDKYNMIEDDVNRAGEIYIKMNEQQRKSLTNLNPPPPPISQK